MSQSQEPQHNDQNPRIRKPVNISSPKNTQSTNKSEPDGVTETASKPSFAERCRTSRFWLVRAMYKVVSSIWMVVMVVGGFIAWLIAMLFI